MLCRALALVVVVLGCLTPPGAGRAAAQACGPGTYTYKFVNHCAQTIFLGQNGPGTSSTPSQSGNWALAPNCTGDLQCGTGQTCHIGPGQSRGKCTCQSDADCPGSATCNAAKRCEIKTTFCMPQAWSSGNFWPRTGCALNPTTLELNCMTGQCGGDPVSMTGGQLDCGAGSGQVGPTPPITLIEMTTSSTSGNYDVSLNNGYNVEAKVTSRGGTGSTCSYAGCTSDVSFAGTSPTCPANLIFSFMDPTTSAVTAAGCYQPLDACLSSGAGTPPASAPAGLMCTQTITTDSQGNTPVPTVLCGGGAGGAVTYLDMYEAKNTADPTANTQITANGGTPTAWALEDCPPGTSALATDFVKGSPCKHEADCTVAGQSCADGFCRVAPPDGIGVCLSFVGGVLVPDEGCSASNIGAACGQYAAAYPDALGYTCQAVNYGNGSVAYPCVPPAISGLGTCNDTGATAFYPTTGGLFNATWIKAGLQAGGGTTPYYETLKGSCPAAYTWQYDDVSGGRACALPGDPDDGFTIEFCASEVHGTDAAALAAAVLPGVRSVPIGTLASAFATIVNSGESAATGCTIAPVTPVPGATFSYQTTEASTNLLTGPVNTPVDIPPTGLRTFVIAFAPTAVLSPTDVALTFRCDNAPAARILPGINTLRLAATSALVPDIVALAATLKNDGVVRVPGVGGTGVFSVATANVGAGGEIVVSADTGSAALPVTVSLCRTNPATGVCLAAPAPTVTAEIVGGATPTFGVFVKADGPVPLDHATSRVFVRFTHGSSIRGLTSVSVQTQ